MDIKWVCKEESQEDDDRDILEEETALEVIAKYISSFRTLSIALSVNKNTSKNFSWKSSTVKLYKSEVLSSNCHFALIKL